MTNILLEPFKWTSELENYKKLLLDAADTESKWPVFNDGTEHAAILMSVIFQKAQKYIHIYSHTLNPNLSNIDIYYESLKKCIDRGVEVKLLLQSKDALTKENPSIEMIRESNSENVKILTDKQHKILKSKLNEMDIHFAVSDDIRYRLEYNINDRKAISSFNDPSVAKVLKRAFDDAFSH